MIAEEGGLKKRIFDWAIAVGLKVSDARQAGKKPSLASSLAYKVADRLVFSTIRERFGGRLRFFVSAAAALDRDVAQWFDAVGIIVLEGYGLTETAAASFINRPNAYRFGTVGWPFPGTEVKIADDGEILLKGPGVMTGYHDLPDATAEALDAGRLVPHRRHRRDRRRRIPAHHRPQEGHVQDLAGQVRRAVGDRRRRSRASARTRASSSSTARASPTASRWSASTPKRSPNGPASTAWRASPSPRSRAMRRPRS